MIQTMYCDGGVIGHNPSLIGGTWAWCWVDANDTRVAYGQGHISPAEAELPAVTNNLTGMLALIYGLERLPVDFRGMVCSDSQITRGRVFWGWKWNGVPGWVHRRFQAARKRLVNFLLITPVQLDGHPTVAQLESRIGKRGNPVSVHNVWCDRACGEAGQNYLKMLEVEIAR